VLDMDGSVSETHGAQEGSAYNGHFGCTCYHPSCADATPAPAPAARANRRRCGHCRAAGPPSARPHGNTTIAESLGWQLRSPPDGRMGRPYGECRLKQSSHVDAGCALCLLLCYPMLTSSSPIHIINAVRSSKSTSECKTGINLALE
jgi:hypothetical protein